jgi:hypothetical protein
MIPEIGAMAILKCYDADAMLAIERLLAGRSVRFNAAFPGPQLETKRLSALGEHAVSCRDGLDVSCGFNVLNTVVLAKFVEKSASVGHGWVLKLPRMRSFHSSKAGHPDLHQFATGAAADRLIGAGKRSPRRPGERGGVRCA